MNDEAMALALLGSHRPALAEVWCGRHEHRLGKVYELPGRGRVLALNVSTFRAQEIDPDSEHPTETVGFRAALRWLDEDFNTIRRCRCGSWGVGSARLRAKLAEGERTIYAVRSWPATRPPGGAERHLSP